MANDVIETKYSLSSMPAFPDEIAEHAAFNKTSWTLYVTRAMRSHPLLMSWIARANNLNNGRRVIIFDKEIDEIASLRAEGHRVSVKSVGEDELKNRVLALDLIRRAASLKTSDMHFLIRDTYTEVQVKVKGDYKVLDRYSQAQGESLSRTIFQGLANVKDKTYNPRDFQNAQISCEEIREMGLTSIRLIRGPAYPIDAGGGFVVLRLQYDKSRQPPSLEIKLNDPRRPNGELCLAKMGYSEKQVNLLKFLAECPSGIVFFTGPTGSGKTTGLVEMLTHAAREYPEKRQVTIEDPVEYPMPWAIQLVVTNAENEEATGEAFTERLRAGLRMDPDIIFMGELRGADSAIAAINAALTGHQVWTTLHVTDPFQTIDRLEIMDNVRLNRRVFCDHKVVRGIVAQRLLPTLCPSCAEPLHLHADNFSKDMLSALATWGDIRTVRVRGAGCQKCEGDGIVGRCAVAEVVVTTSELMKDCIEHGTEIARANYRKLPESDTSLLENALKLVFAGKVDPRAVSRSVDVIVPKRSGL
jgi:type II secretory ATPase GspE/PulE/Tfp pilus assembly ATPase PilB-like protein